MALSSAKSLNIFEVPPLEIKEILKDDNSFDNPDMEDDLTRLWIGGGKRRLGPGGFEEIFLVNNEENSGDELLSDSFPYKEIENGMLSEVEGKWVVQGAVTVDIGANPSAEGGDEDEGVDDQAIKVVDIVDTFRLQEQPAFDKKQFVTYMKSFVGESMHDDGSLVFAYYKDGATNPTFLYFPYGLKEVKC
ncbi:hypothetical protein PVK06_048212 [Gossypium arboreum]|uniref:TCTP domain-containing protein n=1 Tax=Gossypium arboreum TaxID=29729 RepID=A0ABR0MFL5_GOSAR|nr:hypothetical protein PVK06_048212 [Gossypium arboreum]